MRHRWNDVVAHRAALVLVAALIPLIGGGTAHADEPSPSAASRPSSHAEIRRRLLAGPAYASDAEALLAERLAEDISSAERAALLELYSIGTAWSWTRPRALDATDDASVVGADERALSNGEWQVAFGRAHADIVRGAFASALKRVRVLVATAPDIIDASRAVELRSLAVEALRLERPAGSAASSAASGTPPQAGTRWYGWQTLVADGAAVVMTPFVPLLGLPLFAVGAPVVHLAHGNGAGAATSLGLRLGAPALGALSGAALWGVTASCNGDMCGLGSVAFALGGACVGAAAAVAADAALVAKERIAVETPRSAVASVRPTAAPRREGGFDVGIGGTW